MASVLCPSISAISNRLAPFIARYEAAVCLKSWNLKFFTLACLSAPLKAPRMLIGPLSVALGNTKVLLPYRCVCWVSTSKAKLGSGTARASLFFVVGNISLARFRSTSDHRNDNSSPRLAPVVMASTTTVYR